MDIKQFELLQASVQWAVDEERRHDPSWDEIKRSYESPTPGALYHEQEHWGRGVMTDDFKIVHDSEDTEYAVVCPTAGCVAGNAIVLAGEKFVSELRSMTYRGAVMVEECWSEESGVQPISTRAAELMGLGLWEWKRLFHGENSVEDIVHYATGIAAKHGYQLEIA